MNSVLSVVLCFGLLSAAGCRSDPNRELLERELRDHEDEIYGLQDQCDDLHHQLEACRRENAALKKGAATEPGDGNEAAPPRAAPRPPSEVPGIPKIELGTPDSSPSEPPSPPAKRPVESPGRSSANSTAARPAALQTDPPGPIERLAINRLMTGGHSFSGKPGDDGLLVVFAPRDSSGRPIQAAGEVSIAVIDPQVSGPAARVARWDFAAAEVAAHYRQGPLTNAFHLELLWPEHPPEHGELKLFVRFTTPDGHRFEENQTIRVRLAGSAEPSPTWTKAEPPQRWEPATLPAGAQFDPDAESAAATAPPPSRPLNKNSPRTDENQSDGDSTPRAASRRRGWSPYR